MGRMATAERVCAEASDNFVFQRSLLAYHAAAERIDGDVLEIGTGSGYGVEVIAPHARSFVTLDKHVPEAGSLPCLPHVRYMQATVPPLPFADGSFDFVISFQVIEHIRRDVDFVREVHRVLRPGGQFIVTTPNAPMSLTRNPWHVREYTADELRDLLARSFSAVEMLGVAGNDRVMAYYEQNRRSVARITRFDVLDLQHRLPRCLLQLPYDLLNRINRRRLLRDNTDLTTSIRMEPHADFVGQQGVKVIIGKGGMGPDTKAALQKYKQVYVQACPGCAVVLAAGIVGTKDPHWFEAGMPEAMWPLQAKHFGPFLVTMDSHGASRYDEVNAYAKKVEEEILAEKAKKA